MNRFGWLALLFPAALAAHEGEPLAPHDLWSAWEFDPGVVVPLAIAAFLFLRARALARWQKLAFWAGWWTLVIALISPVHPLGETLFSAHMAQHELLMIVAAPLLVLSRPVAAFLWGIPFEWRRTLGRWSRAPWFERAWRALTDPLSAWVTHAIAIWGWHIPALFQATLTSDAVHAAQHASFLGSALVYWWSVFNSRDRANGYGVATLSVFTTAIHTGLLGAFLTLSPKVWYPAYGNAAAAWGLTPLQDQQLGGVIMWVPAGIVYIAAGLWLFAAWLRNSESRMKAALLGCTVIAAVGLLNGCNRGEAAVYRQAAVLTGGDPMKGRAKIEYYGCGACHTIAGVPNAFGLVGPPLNGIARRMYVAGMLENTPDNMARWVHNPKEVNGGTAMPYLGVTDADSRDITAYLYTLR